MRMLDLKDKVVIYFLIYCALRNPEFPKAIGVIGFDFSKI